MLFTTVVVGTVLSEDDVCGNFIEHDHDSIGHYDREECNACREYGKGKGDCCDALYCFHHNLGPIYDSQPCRVMDEECTVGKGMCIPGMRCVGTPGKCVRQPRRYDPNLGDGCFTDNETPDNYCWSVYNISFPEGNWKGEGGRGSNDCGTRCTKMYNPQYQGEYCFQDNDTPDNYCWYPHDFFPIGDWRGVGGRSYGDCGDECTTVHDPQVYDPSRDYCYKDKDNANKYCWYPIHRFPCPKGQWEGSNAARGQCGDKCSEVICYFPNSQTPPYTCIVADQGPHPDPINCF